MVFSDLRGSVINALRTCFLCPNRLCNGNNENLFVGDVCELSTTKRKKDFYNNNTKSQCEFQLHIITVLARGTFCGMKIKSNVYKSAKVSETEIKLSGIWIKVVLQMLSFLSICSVLRLQMQCIHYNINKHLLRLSSLPKYFCIL